MAASFVLYCKYATYGIVTHDSVAIDNANGVTAIAGAYWLIFMRKQAADPELNRLAVAAWMLTKEGKVRAGRRESFSSG